MLRCTSTEKTGTPTEIDLERISFASFPRTNITQQRNGVLNTSPVKGRFEHQGLLHPKCPPTLFKEESLPDACEQSQERTDRAPGAHPPHRQVRYSFTLPKFQDERTGSQAAETPRIVIMFTGTECFTRELACCCGCRLTGSEWQRVPSNPYRPRKMHARICSFITLYTG